MYAGEIASYLWINNTITPPAAQYSTWQTNINLANSPQGLPNGVLSITPTAGTTNACDIIITWLQQSDTTAAAVTQTLTTRVIIPTL
jgi:hypothetical protein